MTPFKYLCSLRKRTQKKKKRKEKKKWDRPTLFLLPCFENQFKDWTNETSESLFDCFYQLNLYWTMIILGWIVCFACSWSNHYIAHFSLITILLEMLVRSLSTHVYRMKFRMTPLSVTRKLFIYYIFNNTLNRSRQRRNGANHRPEKFYYHEISGVIWTCSHTWYIILIYTKYSFIFSLHYLIQ